MKLKNICLGIACIAVVSACNDKMDYHEYTSYDKDYVLSLIHISEPTRH